jgi:hypothetical protein
MTSKPKELSRKSVPLHLTNSMLSHQGEQTGQSSAPHLRLPDDLSQTLVILSKFKQDNEHTAPSSQSQFYARTSLEELLHGCNLSMVSL